MCSIFVVGSVCLRRLSAFAGVTLRGVCRSVKQLCASLFIYLLIANIQSQRLRDYVLSHRTLRVRPSPQHVDDIDAEQLRD